MTPRPSPRSAVAENARLACTSRSTPSSAIASPARKRPLGRCRHSTQAASVTKIDARLASSVELATDVYWIDQCQNARSPAKAMPARSSETRWARKLVVSPVFNEKNKIQSSGTARLTRQKALAVGPTSDTRTQNRDRADQIPPA